MGVTGAGESGLPVNAPGSSFAALIVKLHQGAMQRSVVVTPKLLSHRELFSLSFFEELCTKWVPPSNEELQARQTRVKTNLKHGEPERRAALRLAAPATSSKRHTGRNIFGISEVCVSTRTYFGTDAVTPASRCCCCAPGCAERPPSPAGGPGSLPPLPHLAAGAPSAGSRSAGPAEALRDTLLAKCLGAKCVFYSFRDLRNLPPDCPSALPLLRVLGTLPSTENVCLGADTFSFTVSWGVLHQDNFKTSHSAFKSFLWLHFFDDDCQP